MGRVVWHSTLADRLLELTGTITVGRGANYNRQVLDKLRVERERGITVKAQTATMLYHLPSTAAGPGTPGGPYLLNLIDTPGHVDFSYEVSRSLAACQGVLLLVDAVQGIQAQTVANYLLAADRGLAIVPVVNKVDLPSADPAATLRQMETALGIDVRHAVQVSAKTGLNVAALLPQIVRLVPPYDVSAQSQLGPMYASHVANLSLCLPLSLSLVWVEGRPVGEPRAPLRALLFDSWFDDYRGVICLVHIVDGVLRRGVCICVCPTHMCLCQLCYLGL